MFVKRMPNSLYAEYDPTRELPEANFRVNTGRV